MNKKELIKIIKKKHKIKNIEHYIDIILNSIIELLKKNNKLTFKNFGTFKKVKRKERIRINPNNGQIIKVPEYETIIFRPSKNFLKEKK